MSKSPYQCFWGSFALGFLTGAVIFLITVSSVYRSDIIGFGGRYVPVHLFTAWLFIGPFASVLLALVSIMRRERPRWPALVSAGTALCPLALWLYFLWTSGDLY